MKPPSNSKACNTAEFGINEQDIERICGTRARQNNNNARLCGESDSLKASDLLDLYYKQAGKCCTCACVLTVQSIQLDHIVEVNGRAKLAAFIAGRPHAFGPTAAIENVQWICRTCNCVKETCRRNGIDLTQYMKAVAAQASEGFPIRKSVVVTGSFKSKSQLRVAVLKQLFEKRRQSLTVREACDAIHGTDYDCCPTLVTRELRRIGWRGASWRSSQKIAVVLEVLASTDGPMKTKTDWWRLANDAMVERINMSICFVRFCQIVDDHGIRLSVLEEAPAYLPPTLKLRSPCSLDRASVLAVAKEAGTHGLTKQEIGDKVISPNKPEQIIMAAIDELIDAGRLQQSASANDKLVYAASSKEAAQIIGVSTTRLKKWASRNWDGLAEKPDFFKASDKPKGHRFYALDKLHAFSESRRKHKLDLSVSGQRQACVDGGKLGGRPAFAASH